MRETSTYETDFYAWAMRNADLLRQGRLTEVDADHIAEELESMGKSTKRALQSRLAVLAAHLLKWHYQAGKRSPSWKNTIKVQRLDLIDLLDENPSLRPQLVATLERAFLKARLLAADDTGLDDGQFPAACPFTVEQVLDADFFPEGTTP